MLNRFTRPKPIAWFFFLLGFGLTVALGTWQVERLRWKENLIADLAEANAKAPLIALPSDPAELKPLQFRKATLSGTWVTQGVPAKPIEFHITPRYLNNQFGYAIISPLQLRDGRILMVNRGWVPGKKKLAETRPESLTRGKATLTGIIRIDRDRGYFTPTNQPEKNIWFARDVDAMAEYAKLENVIPAMVDVITPPPLGGRLGGGRREGDARNSALSEQVTPPPQPSPYRGGGKAVASQKIQTATHLPIPSDGTIRLRNDHLSYILTWYGIALGILVIFLVYHRKKN